MKKRFPRLLLFPLALVFVFSVISIPAFGKDRPIKIILGHPDPEHNAWASILKAWGKELEERTKGKVAVQYSWGALGKTGEFFDLTKSGIVDVGFVVPGYGGPGKFPMSSIIGLPYNLKSGEMTCKALFKWAEKGYLDKEFSDVKLLHISVGMGEFLLTKKAQVTRFDQVKGLKIWTPTGPTMAKVKALGGVPVSLPPPDIYQALHKGVLDGLMLEWAIMEMFKIHELIKFASPLSYGTVMVNIVMNKKTFNKLPPKGQAMVEDTREKYSLSLARGWDEYCERGEKLFLDAGGKVLEWEPGEKEKIFSAYKPIWEAWISDKEKRGINARKAVDDLYRVNASLGMNPPAIGYTPKN